MQPDIATMIKQHNKLRTWQGHGQIHTDQQAIAKIAKAWDGKPQQGIPQAKRGSDLSDDVRPITTSLMTWRHTMPLINKEQLPQGHIQFATYNCNSLRRAGRIDYIWHVLGECAIIALQGTCWKAEPGIPVQAHIQSDWPTNIK